MQKNPTKIKKIWNRYNKYSVLIIILLVSIVLRIPSLTHPIFHDDFLFANYAADKLYFYHDENIHPYTTPWINNITTGMFGLSNFDLRLATLIFSLGVIIISFKIAQSLFDMRTANITAGIMAILAWAVYGSGMSSIAEGGVIAFFMYLSILFFILYRNSGKKKFLILCGLSTGMTLITKEPGVLLFPIYLLFDVLSGRLKRFKELFKEYIIIGLLSLIFVLLYVSVDFIFNNSSQVNAFIDYFFSAMAENAQAKFNYLLLYTVAFFKVLIWMTPALLIIPILSLIEGRHKGRIYNKRSRLMIFYTIIAVVVLFYMILIPPNGDYSRFFLLAMPALSIICAEYISRNIEKKKFVYIFALALIVFIGLELANIGQHPTPYEPDTIKDNLLSLNLDAGFPIFSETNNSGFNIKLFIILAVYAVSIILFIIWLVLWSTKKKKAASSVLAGILVIALGYNLLIYSEFTFHITGPDYGKGINRLIGYSKENSLNEPLILLKNYEMRFYLRDQYKRFVIDFGISETDADSVDSLKRYLEKNGGTIIFTDMPPIDREGEFWKTINLCNQRYVYSDKGFEIAYVYDCGNLITEQPDRKGSTTD